MIDEALAYQSESYKTQAMLTSFHLDGESFLKISVDDFLLYYLSFHGHHISFTARVSLFVSFGEVVEIVSA